jgi:hypothetical protein
MNAADAWLPIGDAPPRSAIPKAAREAYAKFLNSGRFERRCIDPEAGTEIARQALGRWRAPAFRFPTA